VNCQGLSRRNDPNMEPQEIGRRRRNSYAGEGEAAAVGAAEGGSRNRPVLSPVPPAFANNARTSGLLPRPRCRATRACAGDSGCACECWQWLACQRIFPPGGGICTVAPQPGKPMYIWYLPVRRVTACGVLRWEARNPGEAEAREVVGRGRQERQKGMQDPVPCSSHPLVGKAVLVWGIMS